MRTRARDPVRDEGFALITALLAAMVLVSLGLVAMALSNHSAQQSSSANRRNQAVHAAEAGVDRFFRYLGTADPTSVQCSIPAETLGTTPMSSFSVTATYYPDSQGIGAALACPPTSTPRAALIRSVGSSGSVTRVMQSLVRLATTGGASLGPGAIFADRDLNFSGAAQVIGNPDDADVYSNGDVNLTGGGTVFGNVYSQKTVELKGGTEVKKDVTSKLRLSISGGAIVWGNARSTTANVINSGTIKANAYYCTGGPPGGLVLGSKIQECPSPAGPTARTFPDFPYDSGVWQAFGYTIQNFTTCIAAESFIDTIVSGSYVVRITAACTLSVKGGTLVRGNLAIINNGDIDVKGAVTGVPATAGYNLYLVAKFGTARPCTANGIKATGGAAITGVNVLFHTPCTIDLSGGAYATQGQVIGGDIKLLSTTSVTYKPVLVPGLAPLGFQLDIAYLREIA